MKVAIPAFLQKLLKALTFIYCASMFTLFLFYVENAYFNITDAKYHCFLWLTIIYFLGCMFCGCFYLFFHSNTIILIKKFALKLSITDWGMLMLTLSHVITTLICEYPQYSFSGEWGRHMGLIFSVSICMMYFLVSRFLSHYEILLNLFLGSCFIIFILGLINALGFDPLHFYTDIKPSQRHLFLSTIGNATFYADLLCLSLPLAVSLYLNAKQRLKKGLLTAWITLGFSSILISNIDGAYLGVSAFMLYYFNRCCRSNKGITDFLQICLIALCSILLLHFLTYPFDSLVFEGISAWLMNSRLIWLFLIITGLLIIAIKLYPKEIPEATYKKIRYAVMLTLIIIACIIIFLILYVTWINPSYPLKASVDYLRFSNTWGHNRGYLWQSLINNYLAASNPLVWLFGKGLDCTRLIMAEITSTPVAAVYYDHAHSEYIQYLVTSGFVSLAIYLFVYGSLIVRMRHSKVQPYARGLIAAFIAHGFAAATGLNQPITTPLLYLLFAFTEAMLRNRNTQT